jgi:polyisoprenoid-binding protein YceI
MTREGVPQLERYRLDPAASTFMVQAFAGGLFSAFGHNPKFLVTDFFGEAEFVARTLEKAALRLVINANSLSVTNVNEKDRKDIERTMRTEVLETSKYREIVFATDNISLASIAEGQYRARALGDLTLHGVTLQDVAINGEVVIRAGSLRIKGQCTVKQTDFKIKLVSVAAGTLNVKNEVKCSFDIVGVSVG